MYGILTNTAERYSPRDIMNRLYEDIIKSHLLIIVFKREYVFKTSEIFVCKYSLITAIEKNETELFQPGIFVHARLSKLKQSELTKE